MNDVDNRLSAIDLSVPGGRFVVASDDNGSISSTAAQALLPQMPIPYVTSKDAGWTAALLRPSYLRFAPRVGLAWVLPGQQDTVITAGFGIFPESVGVQRAAGARADAALLLCEDRQCRGGCGAAPLYDRQHMLLAPPTAPSAATR